MLETRAIVVKLEGREAVVESLQGSGCGACDSKSCGSGKLSETFSVRPRQFRALNDVNAQVGEEVEISVTDGALFRSALMLYGLPLVMLFVGALLGAQGAGSAAASDKGAALGALLGLLAGFLIARTMGARRRESGCSGTPSISRRADTA